MICNHSSACFPWCLATSLFYHLLFPLLLNSILTSLNQSNHILAFCFFFFFFRPISRYSVCIKSQGSSIILAFRFSFVQPTSSPSAPHPSYSALHPSCHRHLHHKQLLDSGGSCVRTPIIAGIRFCHDGSLGSIQQSGFINFFLYKSCSILPNGLP